MIDEQFSVQVVHFMLDHAREKIINLDPVEPSGPVLIGQPNLGRPFDIRRNPRQTEATFGGHGGQMRLSNIGFPKGKIVALA